MKTADHPLALRVPPLAVTLLVGLGAWLSAHAFPALRLDSVNLRVVAAALGLVGGGCSLLGVISFRRARTTVNPMHPGAASALVVSGVDRFTRNPMYAGMLLVLLAWAAFLSSLLALLGPVVFVLYINRFQIAPEERALQSLFGSDYTAYQARGRRWL